MKIQPIILLFIVSIFGLSYLYNLYKEEYFSTPSDRYCATVLTSKECDDHAAKFLKDKDAFIFTSDFKIVKNHNCVRKCNKLLNSNGGRQEMRDFSGGIDLFGYFWKMLYLSLEDDKLNKTGTYCFDRFRQFGIKGSERQGSKKIGQLMVLLLELLLNTLIRIILNSKVVVHY